MYALYTTYVNGFGLPQVYRERSFSFRMYFNEGNEAPHVHVVHAGNMAKFWLSPVALCTNRGFSPAELRWIQATLAARSAFFMEQWHVTQGHKK